MRLEELGYTKELEKFRLENGLDVFEAGRVIAEHKERYIIKTAKGEFEAEVTGNMRYAAKSREDFPAVGDWVALTEYDAGYAIIHRILPRSSVITREAVGQFGELQLIAANIDYAFIIQSVDRDFNLNRMERYLTICHSSKVRPIILLTKVDLVDEQSALELLERIRRRTGNVPVIAVSNLTDQGYDEIYQIIEKGMTYCMLGSSGVGKSTLVNNLSGKHVMKTESISSSTNKGRHMTTHRQLTVLNNGGILIDNPGMREVGISDVAGGLEETYDKLIRLSRDCRFSDCSHTAETGCAVIEAVEKGELDASAYENYIKLAQEKAHFESTVSEKRNKDKMFGKMMKQYKRGWNTDTD
jgi:ribosome biogenesis GTPase / thiamine phosphate phosphatase